MAFRPGATVLAAVLLLSVLAVAPSIVGAPSVNAAGEITSSITDFGLDTDGDSLFNYLLVNATVNVTAPGTFLLALGAGSYASLPAVRALDLGLHVLEVRIAGWDLNVRAQDGPYSIGLTLTDYETYAYLDSAVHTTAAYAAADFDPPAAVVEGYTTPWAVDTNGNGLYDELRMNYTLNVTEAHAYVTTVMLGGSTGSGYIATSFPSTPDVGVGVHDLVFAYPGYLVRQNQITGVYDYDLYVCQWLVGDSMSSCFTTAVVGADTAYYNWTQFDYGIVHMAPPFSDHGVDQDGDGLFDAISVHVPLQLDAPAAVSVMGMLGGFYQRYSIAYASGLFDAGEASVDVLLPTYALRTQSVDGPYLVDLYLSSNLTQGAQSHESYTTSNYSRFDFNPPSASLGAITWSPVDTDSDTRYDILNATVNLSVSKDGTYLVHGLLSRGIFLADLEAGRMLHLSAGTTSDVTLSFSGVAVHRASVDGPWSFNLEVDRLSGPPGDTATLSTASPPFLRSNFTDPPREHLTGSVRYAGTPFGASGSHILAVDPSHAFWTLAEVQTDGSYDLELYNGTFTVSAGWWSNSQTQTEPVVVNGTAAADFELGAGAETDIRWDATLEAWNRTSVTTDTVWAYLNSTARVAADIFGNFDGYANRSELGLWMEYPFILPYAPWARYTPAMGLGIRIDGHDLAGRTETTAVTSGEGGYLATDPIAATATSTFSSPAAPSPGSTHTVGLTMWYDYPYGLRSNLTLHLPADTVSTATASLDVALFHPDATTWIVDPGDSPGGPATATISVSPAPPPDTTPPTAAFGADFAERGVPVTFDAAGSSDDMGIVNETWNVTVNGTRIMGYGMRFPVTFSEIGTYVVSLTVRDAAGNSGTVSHAVVVRDTTPPSGVGGLSLASVGPSGRIALILSWSPVGDSDLAGYRIYRSSDGGSTFSFLVLVAPGTTQWSDSSVVAGRTYAYRISAVDRYGNEGAASGTVSGSVPLPTAGGSPVADYTLLTLVGIALAAGAVATLVLLTRRRRGPGPPRGPA